VTLQSPHSVQTALGLSSGSSALPRVSRAPRAGVLSAARHGHRGASREEGRSVNFHHVRSRLTTPSARPICGTGWIGVECSDARRSLADPPRPFREMPSLRRHRQASVSWRGVSQGIGLGHHLRCELFVQGQPPHGMEAVPGVSRHRNATLHLRHRKHSPFNPVTRALTGEARHHSSLTARPGAGR
jgi:hypothetical protein